MISSLSVDADPVKLRLFFRTMRLAQIRQELPLGSRRISFPQGKMRIGNSKRWEFEGCLHFPLLQVSGDLP